MMQLAINCPICPIIAQLHFRRLHAYTLQNQIQLIQL